MKPKTEIIDIHTHIFDDTTYESYMARASDRVKKAITIQYWTTNDKPTHPIDKLFKFAQSKGLFVIAAININFDIAEQLAVIKKYGQWIVGLKMYPGYQHFYPFDKMVDPVAEYCQQHA